MTSSSHMKRMGWAQVVEHSRGQEDEAGQVAQWGEHQAQHLRSGIQDCLPGWTCEGVDFEGLTSDS